MIDLVRIMKSGSGSLHALFEPHTRGRDFIHCGAATLEGARAIIAKHWQAPGPAPHVVTHHHPALPEADLSCIVMRRFVVMRHPVDRVLSLASHMRRAGSEASIVAWLDEMGDDHPYLHNVATRQLSGGPMWYPWDNEAPCHVLSETRLTEAKMVLHVPTTTFGLCEHFGEFQRRVEQRMGWPEGDIIHTNASKPRPPVSDAVRQRIAEANAIDMELYHWAAAQLELTDYAI